MAYTSVKISADFEQLSITNEIGSIADESLVCGIYSEIIICIHPCRSWLQRRHNHGCLHFQAETGCWHPHV